MRTKTERTKIAANATRWGYFREPLSEGGLWVKCPENGCEDKIHGWPLAWDNERTALKKLKIEIMRHIEDHDNGGLEPI